MLENVSFGVAALASILLVGFLIAGHVRLNRYFRLLRELGATEYRPIRAWVPLVLAGPTSLWTMFSLFQANARVGFLGMVAVDLILAGLAIILRRATEYANADYERRTKM